MKRTIFLSLVLLFSILLGPPDIQAQYSNQPARCNNVQSTFFDCRLGSSTYSDVHRILKSKGYDVSNCSYNMNILVPNVMFADISFDYALFIFKEGMLDAVHFVSGFSTYAPAYQRMESLYKIVKKTYPLKRMNTIASAEMQRYAATNSLRTVVVNLTNQESQDGSMGYFAKLIYFDNILESKPHKGL